MRRIAGVVAGMSMLLSLGPFTSASADSGPAYAPVDRPGPALRASAADLEKAVQCHGDFSQGREAVLLVPGSAFTVETQYSWSWGRALTRGGIPWCGVTPPFNSLGDVTIAGEYDAYAIRKTYAMAGNRPIAVVGHSQGGMRPRWALRFWPDTRPMVADMVGVAPENRGLGEIAPAIIPPLVTLACLTTLCPTALHQVMKNSRFMTAVNSIQETFPGIDYSVIYSLTDGLVQPADTVLNPAPGTVYKRISLQSVCPLNVANHLFDGSIDPVAWALIQDAITHPGPADPTRIARTVCSQVFAPGIDPVQAALYGTNAPLQIARAVATSSRSTTEPELPAYVFAH